MTFHTVLRQDQVNSAQAVQQVQGTQEPTLRTFVINPLLPVRRGVHVPSCPLGSDPGTGWRGATVEVMPDQCPRPGLKKLAVPLCVSFGPHPGSCAEQVGSLRRPALQRGQKQRCRHCGRARLRPLLTAGTDRQTCARRREDPSWRPGCDRVSPPPQGALCGSREPGLSTLPKWSFYVSVWRGALPHTGMATGPASVPNARPARHR